MQLDPTQKRTRHHHRSARLTTELLEDRRMLAWTPAGPAPIINGGVENVSPNNAVNGAIHAVVAHPTDADTLYLGSVNGGVWRTNNATDLRPTWTPLTDNMRSLSIGDLEMDPTDSNTLLAGVGRPSAFAGAGGDLTGLMLTRDAGNTWTQISDPLFAEKEFSAVYVRGDLLLAASNGGFTNLRDIAAAFGERTGGLFRSDDGGATWTSIEVLPRDANTPDVAETFNAFDLVNDPTNPDRFYLTIQDEGIFRSDDGGLNWTDVTSGTMRNDLDTTEVGFDENGNIIRALANPGINNNSEIGIGSDGRVFVGMLENAQVEHVAYSDDFGATWTEMDLPFTPDIENGNLVGLQPRTKEGAQGFIHFSLAVDPNNSDIIYIGGDRQGGNTLFPNGNSIGAADSTGRLFRGDVNETPINLAFNPTLNLPIDLATATFGDLLAFVSPQWEHLTHSDGIIGFASGGGTASRSAPHADSRGFAFDANGDMIQVDDGGIFRRTSPQDNTGDWFSLVGNLTVTEAHNVAYDSNSDILVAGTQDNSSIQQVSSGSLTWEPVVVPSTAPFGSPFRFGGDGGDVAIDDTSTPGFSIRYTSAQNFGGFRRQTYNAENQLVSQDVIGTLFFELAAGGTAAIDEEDLFFVTPMELNNVDPTSMLVATRIGLFESFNQGDSFFIVPGTDPADPLFPIFRLIEDPGAMVYGGFRYGVANEALTYWAIDDEVLIRDTQFQNQQLTVAQFPGTAIVDLTADTNDWSNLFVADEDSVYFTTDQGVTWVDITGNLPGFDSGQIRSMEFIPGFDRSALLVGTNRGVYVTSTDNLGTWSLLSTGMPNAPVYDMEYDATDDVLVASTLGRGVFTLPNASAGVTDQATLSTLRTNSIYGNVWNDTDSSRFRNNSEGGVGDVVVFNDLDDDGVRDPFEAFTTTSADGSFRFDVPGPTTYNLTIELPDGATFTSALDDQSAEVFVAPLSSVSGVNFGIMTDGTTGGGTTGGGTTGGGTTGGGTNTGGSTTTPPFIPTNPGVIEGRAFMDADSDSAFSNGDLAVTDVWAYVDVDNSCIIGVGEPAARVAADGTFEIVDVPAGTYNVRLTPSQMAPHDACLGAVVTVGDGTTSTPTTISNVDFAIAPPSSGSVDFGFDDSASHGIMAGMFLGNTVNPGTSVDDGDNDGVAFFSGLQPGQTAEVIVVANQDNAALGRLNAWIDFNNNGSLFDPGEQIFTNLRLDTGENRLSFVVPASATQTSNLLARFRWGLEFNLGPNGPATAGEVEDYRVTIPSGANTGLSAVADDFTVSEDSVDNMLDVVLNDTQGIVGSGFTLTAVTQPTNGTTSIMDGMVKYTPNADFAGADVFTYTITDSLGGTSIGTVTVTVTNTNDAPTAVDDTFNIEEGPNANPLAVLTNDFDVDGDSLTITAVSQPANGGVVTIASDQVIYTPAPGFVGEDTFTYTIADGAGLTSTATVTVNVIDLEAVVRYRLEATDAAGNPISNIGTGQTFFLNVYVQDLRTDAAGVFSAYVDVFYDANLITVGNALTFGPEYGNAQKFDLSVAGMIDEAGATDGVDPLGPSERLLWRAPFTADNPGTVNFSANDADLIPPHETTVYGLDGFIPATLQEFVGTDLTISGTSGVSDDTFMVNEDSTTLLDVLQNDVPPPGRGPFTIIDVGPPTSGGTAMVVNGQIEYMPPADFIGTDSFVYTVEDMAGAQASATVTISVLNVTDPPVATDDLVQVAQSSSNNFLDVLANDFDPDDPNAVLSITNFTEPTAGGMITITSEGIIYTPAVGFSGQDTFTYTIIDADGLTDVATVTVNVNAVDALVSYRLQAVDANGNSVSTVAVGQTFFVDVFVQDLRQNAQGVFSAFLDIMYDPSLATAVGPITHSDVYNAGTSGDLSTAGLVDEAGGADGAAPLGPDELFLLRVPFQADAVGTLTLFGDPADIVPIHETSVFGMNTPVSPDLQIFGNTTVMIAEEGVNDDTFTVLENSTNNLFDVLSNDLPPAGAAPFTIVNVGVPNNGGTAMLSGTEIEYAPLPGFFGTETFTYTVEDNNGVQSTAQVTVTVLEDQTGNEDVGYEFEITDTSGTPIDSINVGGSFQLNVYTRDMRDDPQGVFAGYLDVLYNGTGAAIVDSVAFGEKYDGGQSFDATTQGLIDELGAVDGVSPFDNPADRFLLATVTFTATAEGMLDFTGDPADITPAHFTLVFGSNDPVDEASIAFGSDSITITPTQTLFSPFNNSTNPFDVDLDGTISPLDALIVINDISANGSRQLAFPTQPLNSGEAGTSLIDVDNDFFLTPLDALMVINRLSTLVMVDPSASIGITQDPLGDGNDQPGVSNSRFDIPVISTDDPPPVIIYQPLSSGAVRAVDAAFEDAEEQHDGSSWEDTLRFLAVEQTE